MMICREMAGVAEKLEKYLKGGKELNLDRWRVRLEKSGSAKSFESDLEVE